MKYIFFLVTVVVCGSCNNSTKSNILSADAKRDLVVTSNQWKPVINKTSFGLEFAEGPTFSLTNNSDKFSYRRVDFDIYFYDKGGNKIDSLNHRASVKIQPKQTQLIQFVSMALINTNAKSADAKIRSAQND